MATIAWQGMQVGLLTKHEKEAIIAPIMAEVGIELIHTDAFDTDTLGSFDGRIERTLTALEAGKEKARLAADLTGCEIGLGSEGTFSAGPLGLGHALYEIVVAYAPAQQWIAVGRAWQMLEPQPDLRAHKCPPRRPIIATATRDLLARLQRPCPRCGTPDFSFDEAIPGLPCEICLWPSQQAKGYRACCQSCQHEQLKACEGNAEARFCERCNP